MVLALITLTAIGSYGFLTRAHLQHQVAAQEAVDRDAAPFAQQITLAQATVADLDGQIARLDAMVKTATGRGWTKTAMALVGRQTASRAALVAERQHATERLAAQGMLRGSRRIGCASLTSCSISLAGRRPVMSARSIRVIVVPVVVRPVVVRARHCRTDSSSAGRGRNAGEPTAAAPVAAAVGITAAICTTINATSVGETATIGAGMKAAASANASPTPGHSLIGNSYRAQNECGSNGNDGSV
jgi:hypothetical protein